MEIKEVTIRQVYPDSTCRARASIIMRGGLAVHDICIVQNAKGLFASMPATRVKSSLNADAKPRYKDIVHPIDAAARSALDQAVLEAYTASDGTGQIPIKQPYSDRQKWLAWVGEDLRINNVICRKLFDHPRIKGVFSMVVEENLAIHEMRLIEDGERQFVSMPTLRNGPKEPNVAHPVSPAVRRRIERSIQACYQWNLENPEMLYVPMPWDSLGT